MRDRSVLGQGNGTQGRSQDELLAGLLKRNPRLPATNCHRPDTVQLLITTFTFAPQRNGVADAVGAVALGLTERGHDVTVATAWDPERVSDPISSLKVEEFRLGLGNDLPEEIARYRHFLANHPADVIICHCWQAWNTDLALPGLRASPARKILVSHGYAAHRWVPHPRFPWGLGRWLRGLRYVVWSISLWAAFDHFVFLSPRRDLNRFIDHLLISIFGPNSYSVIPNGVTSSFLRECPRDLRDDWQAEDRCLFLCVSAFDDAKNQKLALRAFRQARSPGVFVFVGGKLNEYSHQLEILAQADGAGDPSAGRVFILQDRGGNFVRRCYAACDVFVLPSRRETQPLTVLQAMAAGRPFISTNVGCVKDLEGGVVVEDEAELSERLAYLSAHPQARELMGSAGREAAGAKYHWDRIVLSYESLCAMLLRGIAEESRTP